MRKDIGHGVSDDFIDVIPKVAKVLFPFIAVAFLGYWAWSMIHIQQREAAAQPVRGADQVQTAVMDLDGDEQQTHQYLLCGFGPADITVTPEHPNTQVELKAAETLVPNTPKIARKLNGREKYVVRYDLGKNTRRNTVTISYLGGAPGAVTLQAAKADNGSPLTFVPVQPGYPAASRCDF